VDDDVVHH
jgi:ferritin-like metal-binding protein YciE